MKLKYILPLLLLLPVLSACDQTDDVIEIFTGKTWRLTAIYYDKGTNNWCKDYWNGNETEMTASYNLAKNNGSCTITFTGIENGDEAQGTYQGYATSGISGKWVANGKNNSFRITGQENPGGNEDVLIKAFINGLKHADKYKGDINNLSIYFEDKDKKDRRLLIFHVAN